MISGIKSIKPTSGLGVGPTEVGGSTWAMCHTMPFLAGSLFSACRNAYGSSVADVYERIQYGQVAPAPAGVLTQGAGSTPAQIAEANRQIIEAAEAEGYTPGRATYQGLTASEIVQDIEEAKSTLFEVSPWLIDGAGVALLLILRR